MILKTTAITIFAIAAGFSLLTANSLVIQIFAQNKTVNMTKAAGNMTNTTSPASSISLTANKTRMHLICHGAACHIISGCVECN